MLTAVPSSVAPSPTLPTEVVRGEGSMYEMLYLRVTQGDRAVSASVIQNVDPEGPMRALWLMAHVNLSRRERFWRYLFKPLGFASQADADALASLKQITAHAARRVQGDHEVQVSEQLVERLVAAVRERLPTAPPADFVEKVAEQLSQRLQQRPLSDSEMERLGLIVRKQIADAKRRQSPDDDALAVRAA